MPPEDGLKYWSLGVKDAGFTGQVGALFEAMVEARESHGFALHSEDLSKDDDKFRQFAEAVCKSFGGSVGSEIIKKGLLGMPRPCAWCSAEESWTWCQTCGGCEICCCDEFHCVDHGSPFNICYCPLSNYRDSVGKPPPE